MNNMDKQSLPALNILRWIIFLPASFGATWIVWFIVTILNRFSLSFMGIDMDSFMARLSVETTSHVAMGAAFVYAGVQITPDHKKIVAYCLAGLGLVVSGFILFPSIIVRNYWAIWGGLCVIGGVGAVTYLIHQGETSID